MELKSPSLGRKALLYAAQNGHEAVVNWFLATGQVDIDLKELSFVKLTYWQFFPNIAFLARFAKIAISKHLDG